MGNHLAPETIDHYVQVYVSSLTEQLQRQEPNRPILIHIAVYADDVLFEISRTDDGSLFTDAVFKDEEDESDEPER